MRKHTWISVFLLVVFALSFVQIQSAIIKERSGRRSEEKILMLSNRPEVTKILSLGHDATVADLLWIRAIQFFGGNFSSLNKPEKKPGMVNLFRNMVALDPHFAAAYQFGGFVMNESIQDSNLAVSFLLEGADKNPDSWRLRFDAGFIAFYQLKDYDIAKRLFVQTSYGENFAQNAPVETAGLVEGFDAKGITDDDPEGEVKFQSESGSLTIDLGKIYKLSLINLVQSAAGKQSFTLSFAGEAASAAQATFTSTKITISGLSEINPPVDARYLRIGDMQTDAPDGFFSLSEVQVFGMRNRLVPSYVDRMAIEMDRAAGRFRVAWDQYLRYYDEAKQKGDEISATLAAQKLTEIYNTKVKEILDASIHKYLEKEGALPSSTMKELVDGGYLQQELQAKMAEDPQFQSDILPVLLGQNGNVYNMLMTWDGTSPMLMKPVKSQEGRQDWTIVSRAELVNQQEAAIIVLQKIVNQYKEENGKYPATMEDLRKNRLFTAPPDLLIDPLGGEYVINQQTGKIEATNPIY